MNLPDSERMIRQWRDNLVGGITYFDSSALIKLMIKEENSAQAALLWDGSGRVISSAIVYPEVRAALASAHRSRRISIKNFNKCKQRWERLWMEINTVSPRRDVLLRAGELAEIYKLRGYDAVHLSSAMCFPPEMVTMVTWDNRLGEAAFRAGLRTEPSQAGNRL